MWQYLEEGRELFPVQVSAQPTLSFINYTNISEIARWTIAVSYAPNAFTPLSMSGTMLASSSHSSPAAVAIVVTTRRGENRSDVPSTPNLHDLGQTLGLDPCNLPRKLLPNPSLTRFRHSQTTPTAFLFPPSYAKV